MNFFNALASPTALCGLAMLPLTKRSLQKLGVVQRKMLRCMGGWKSVEGEKWSGTMRSVQRVALVLFHFVSDEARVENEHLFLDTRNLCWLCHCFACGGKRLETKSWLGPIIFISNLSNKNMEVWGSPKKSDGTSSLAIFARAFLRTTSWRELARFACKYAGVCWFVAPRRLWTNVFGSNTQKVKKLKIRPGPETFFILLEDGLEN